MVFLIKILSLGSYVISTFQNSLQKPLYDRHPGLNYFKSFPSHNKRLYYQRDSTDFEGLLRLKFILQLKWDLYTIPC